MNLFTSILDIILDLELCIENNCDDKEVIVSINILVTKINFLAKSMYVNNLLLQMVISNILFHIDNISNGIIAIYTCKQ